LHVQFGGKATRLDQSGQGRRPAGRRHARGQDDEEDADSERYWSGHGKKITSSPGVVSFRASRCSCVTMKW
jgi:hypothetical protein